MPVNPWTPVIAGTSMENGNQLGKDFFLAFRMGGVEYLHSTKA